MPKCKGSLCQKKIHVFLTQEKSEDLTRVEALPLHLSILPMFLRLDVHKCGYAASQNRSHLSWLGLSRSQKHRMYIFPTAVMLSDLYTLECIFTPSLSRLYFLFTVEELIHLILQDFFFPSVHQHSWNSKGYTSNECWILRLFAATNTTVTKRLPL